jgi:hypothetical protein
MAARCASPWISPYDGVGEGWWDDLGDGLWGFGLCDDLNVGGCDEDTGEDVTARAAGPCGIVSGGMSKSAPGALVGSGSIDKGMLDKGMLENGTVVPDTVQPVGEMRGCSTEPGIIENGMLDNGMVVPDTVMPLQGSTGRARGAMVGSAPIEKGMLDSGMVNPDTVQPVGETRGCSIGTAPQSMAKVATRAKRPTL